MVLIKCSEAGELALWLTVLVDLIGDLGVAAHSHLSLQLQVIQHHLLASPGTCMHVVHIQTLTCTHKIKTNIFNSVKLLFV